MIHRSSPGQETKPKLEGGNSVPSELAMVKPNTLNETDRKNLSTARIITINEANWQPHPRSRGIAFRKIKDVLTIAVLLLAAVALTAGWIFAVGWTALKLIQWIFA